MTPNVTLSLSPDEAENLADTINHYLRISNTEELAQLENLEERLRDLATAPVQFTTSDLGMAIQEHLEDHIICHLIEDRAGDYIEITFIDVSDANNPIVHLDNGQKFKLVILTYPGD